MVIKLLLGYIRYLPPHPPAPPFYFPLTSIPPLGPITALTFIAAVFMVFGPSMKDKMSCWVGGGGGALGREKKPGDPYEEGGSVEAQSGHVLVESSETKWN